MNPKNRPTNHNQNHNPDSTRPSDHPTRKQEKALVVVCIAVAAIMLLSLTRYMFR